MRPLPRARKRFGQHFLTDEGVLQRIADAVQPLESDLLFEIGPGPGALTSYLYGSTARYLAVELDRDLIEPLRMRFPGLELVSGDILKVDLESLLEPFKWRLVGNLPFNISSPLLIRLFGHLDRIEDAHFMFQRELGARLTASPGTKSWGRLGIVTQYFCQVESLFDVLPDAFTPPPKVHSQVVRLTPRRELAEVDLGQFNLVLRMAFSARRKRIANALKSLRIDWVRAGVDEGARADDISVEEFVSLANAIEANAIEVDQ
jgi:16S rRNA (adenine1518-N6/adenine1519-N6)-dimethyltransferase